MRGGKVPEHYTFSLTKKEGDTLLELARVIRECGKSGDFALHENEDEVLEGLIQLGEQQRS